MYGISLSEGQGTPTGPPHTGNVFRGANVVPRDAQKHGHVRRPVPGDTLPYFSASHRRPSGPHFPRDAKTIGDVERWLEEEGESERGGAERRLHSGAIRETRRW